VHNVKEKSYSWRLTHERLNYFTIHSQSRCPILGNARHERVKRSRNWPKK